ncbi:MAG TPA: glycerophosphodiester phosphodiesterase family protein [Thermodesulfobacteriota bacterium]|nr:glycerophosphodiester phosphodiesterase family protein [Thermodesulfobacteriota bacterium]
MARRPLVIAHRGASAYAPENTLAAFRAAIALGADMLELDVQLTADRRLAVIHDQAIDRTCDGRGFVAEMTLAELQRFDAGLWWGPGFAGERIPALEEVLALARGRVAVNIEAKVPAGEPAEGSGREALAEALVAALAEAGSGLTVLVSSFDAGVLRRLRARAPALTLGLLCEARIEGPAGFRPGRLAPYLALAAELGAVSLHPYWRFTGPRLVDAAHAAGLRVYPWTVNRERDLRRLIAIGVDGIITDRPDRLARLLR